MSPAELAIRDIVLEIEATGCDERLTEAVILLGRAQAKVADYVDELMGELTPKTMEKGNDFITVTARCTNGHSQEIKYSRLLGHDWVRAQAELMDGSSKMFVVPPSDNSPIGKCGICKAQVTCEVGE